MAPRKKQSQALVRPGREFKLRLPEDVSERIAKKAEAERVPQNRVIISELAAHEHLQQFANFSQMVRDLEVIIARYGARIMWHDMSEELLNAVDAVLAADGRTPKDAVDNPRPGALLGAVDRLRVVRNGMLTVARSK
jgi:hypothetical protein